MSNKKLDLDTANMLGFRLLDQNKLHEGKEIGAKIGAKDGIKPRVQTMLGSKVGGKFGRKPV